MRQDHAWAARELERLHDDLRRAGDEAEKLVRLYDLSKLFVEHPLVLEVVKTLEAEVVPSTDDTRATVAVWVRDQCVETVKEVVVCLQNITGSGAFSRSADAYAHYHAELLWSGRRTTVAELLVLLVDKPWTDLTTDNLGQLASSVLPSARSFVHAIKDATTNSEHPVVRIPLQRAERAIERAVQTVQTHCNAWHILASAARRAGHKGTLDDIRRFYCSMSCLLNGRVEDSLAVIPEITLRLTAVEQRVERLVSVTRARLSLGPIQTHAVRRLKTHFEHFIRKSLSQACGRSSNKEAVLQEAMDSFSVC